MHFGLRVGCGLVLVALAAACSGDQQTADAGDDASVDVIAIDVSSEADALDLVDGPNVVPVIVNQGLSGSG